MTDRDDRLHQKQIFSNKIFNKVEVCMLGVCVNMNSINKSDIQGTSRSLDFLPPAEDGTESLLYPTSILMCIP